MKCVWIAPVLAGAVMLAAGPASAGALEDCYQRTQSRAEVTPCLNAQKKAATDAMLEQFLAVEQSLADLEKTTGRGGKVAQLKQSQRDFERYLNSQCQMVLRAFDSGTGAGQAQLACEVDLLRDRAAALQPLAPEQKETRK
jgi:uncharacterized protein YecT (DUF1311 family)